MIFELNKNYLIGIGVASIILLLAFILNRTYGTCRK